MTKKIINDILVLSKKSFEIKEFISSFLENGNRRIIESDNIERKSYGIRSLIISNRIKKL